MRSSEIFYSFSQNRYPSNDQPHRQIKDIFDASLYKCPHGYMGTDYCNNEGCKSFGIRCQEQDCKCDQDHKYCEDLEDLQTVNGKDAEHLIKTGLGWRINKQISTMESELRKKQTQLEEALRYFGWSQDQIKFHKKILDDSERIANKRYDELKLKGNDVYWYLKKKQEEEVSLFHVMQAQQENLLGIIEDLQRYFGQKWNDIREEIKQQCQLPLVLMKESEILKREHEKFKIQQMIDELKPSKGKLIFTGTKDGLSWEQFHRKCDDKPNLLYLVKNEHGRIYGGYSPCPISKRRNDRWQIDDTKTSFVFSIDENTKAKLVEKQKAIYVGGRNAENQCLIAFGQSRANFMLSANSLSGSKNNWIQFNKLGQIEEINRYRIGSYQNLKAVFTKEQLVGTRDDTCRLEEVEVYQLTLLPPNINRDSIDTVEKKVGYNGIERESF